MNWKEANPSWTLGRTEDASCVPVAREPVYNPSRSAESRQVEKTSFICNHQSYLDWLGGYSCPIGTLPSYWHSFLLFPLAKFSPLAI
jgi:hypothetical protein